MSADILRRAAEVLRERAQAATPGPWSTTADRPRYITTAAPIEIDEADWGPDVGNEFKVVTARDSRAWRYADVTYIATMHPGVGLIIARGLENHAYDHDAYDCGWAECEFVNAARQIVFEATS